jgi:EmrB/QacA subfamily drug resistance transporter
MFVVSIASFFTAMSLSIVFVVYPDLAAEFPHSSSATLSWVLNIFTIVGAPAFVLGSVIGERYGRKRTLIGGLLGFTLGSVFAALSPGPGWIICARGIQAASSAAILPMSATLIMREFPESHRGMAAAGWSAIGGIAASLGPSLGGFLISRWSWRAAFWLNVPIGIIAIAAAVKVLDESKNEEAPRIPDLIGMFMLMLGVLACVYGLVQTALWGWASPTVIASITVGVALIIYLFYRCAHHPVPLIDLTLFRSRTYSIGNISMTMFALSYFGTQFGTVLFLTQIWGYSIVKAGLLTTPVFALTAIFSPVAGRFSDRFGDEKLSAPAVGLWAIGVGVLAIGLRSERNLPLWFTGTAIAGTGAGLAWGGVFALLLRRVEPDRISLAASITQTLQRIGNALGIAIAVTILGSRVNTTIADHRRMFAAMAIAAVLTAVADIFLMTQSRQD